MSTEGILSPDLSTKARSSDKIVWVLPLGGPEVSEPSP